MGLQVSLLLGGADWPPRAGILWAGLAALAIGLVGARVLARRGESEAIDPSAAQAHQRRVFWTSVVVIFLLSACYLVWTGLRQKRAFAPTYEDEFSYLLQARMLASGRLWLPAHPLADFFESFQIVVRPVYASIYFPGAAAVYSVGAMTGAPSWVVPWLLSAGCVVLMWWVARELLGELYGWLAALLLIGLTIFRMQSLMAMAQIPVLLGGLLMLACWLRWRRHRRWGWLLGLGLAGGYAAISRPIDALCFFIPVTISVLVHLRGVSRRDTVRSIAAIAAGVAPFILVQLAFNRGVTGTWLQTPFGFYARQFYPQTQYGFQGFDRTIQPATGLPQKRAYYEQVAVPFLVRHSPGESARQWLDGRLRTTLTSGVPHAVLLILLPPALMALRRRDFWVPAAGLPLFALLYWPYAFFLPHYTLTTAPAAILLVLGGARELAGVCGRWRNPVLIGMGAFVSLVTVLELPELRRTVADEFFTAQQIRTIDVRLNEGIPPVQRAIVLFRWHEGCNPQEEPVYNIESAWPDDARIIRAHDLGARNAELYRYYSELQPDRQVYLYDRATDTLTPLGAVNRQPGGRIQD